jgi:hypothetical protein
MAFNVPNGHSVLANLENAKNLEDVGLNGL